MNNYCSSLADYGWKKKRNNEEQKLQTEFMKWLAYQHPRVREVSFSIPNEGRRSWHAGKKMKDAGLKKGVPDVFIAYPVKNFHGLFIEFKSKGKKASEAQESMMALLREQDYQAFVIVGDVEEAIEKVNDYLGA